MINYGDRRILIDLDDVLADCTGAAMVHMGVHNWTRDMHAPVPERDILAVYKSLTGIEHSPRSFWEHFKREFWATIPPLPWCFELLDLVQAYAPRENIAILTSPTKCGDCLAGKLDWLDEFLPSWLHRQFLMSPRKQFCAHPYSILIDDCDENVFSFRSFGGAGIVFPQYWNESRDKVGQEMDFVKKSLDRWVLTA